MPRPDPDTHIVEITYSIPIGTHDVDRDPFNPFLRSFERLFRDGQPLKSASLCLFDPFSGKGFGPEIKWLGAFVHTSGNRLLFFPGYSRQESIVTASKANKQTINYKFVPDHITLERNRKDIHMTSPRSQDYHLCGRTKDLAPNYQGSSLMIPFDCPFVEPLLTDEVFEKLPVKQHRFNLSD